MLISVNNGTTAQYRYNAEGQRVYKWANLNTADTNGSVINTTDLHNVINGATTTPCTTNSGKEKNAVACVANQIGVYANNGQSAISQAKLLAVNPARLFAYDGTHMLGEYGATGVALQETIWLGNLPVATLQNGAVYNIYPDQLGTPRVITNASNTEVWKWDSDPFGTTIANEDPTGSGSKFTYNLRFPGQYFDAETGKHYNYFRDYDPMVGRYVESDPIGLRGGVNTYGYVGGNPIFWTDPLGLFGYAYGTGVTVTTIVGTGVTGGMNGEFFSDGSADAYAVKGTGKGADVSADAQVNGALYFGSGPGGAASWAGDFKSINIGAFGIVGSFFWGGGWFGFSLGGGVAPEGVDFGATVTSTTYVPIVPVTTAPGPTSSCK